jgi:hypothetical protein
VKILSRDPEFDSTVIIFYDGVGEAFGKVYNCFGSQFGVITKRKSQSRSLRIFVNLSNLMRVSVITKLDAVALIWVMLKIVHFVSSA